MVMSYIVQGYCFIIIYSFITKDSSERRKGSLLIPSVAGSYVLKLLYNRTVIWLLEKFVDVNKESDWYFIGLIVFSIVLAYLLGILSLSNTARRILEKLKVPYTVNSNFWADVFKEGIWFNVHLKNHNYNYMGQVSYIEESQRNPHIQLENYSMYNVKTGEEIKLNKGKNEKHSIILELKDIDYIETIEN